MQFSCHVKLLALQISHSSFLKLSSGVGEKRQAELEKRPQNTEQLSVQELPGTHPLAALGWALGE